MTSTTRERSKSYYYFVSALAAFFVAALGVYATTIGTNISVTGTLDSSGAATMSSTLTVSGNSSLASADIGGAYAAGGSGSTITAAGKAQFNGNLEINGFATTTASNGNFATEGTLTVTGNSVLTSADIGGAYTAGGGSGITLTAAGLGQFNGALELNGFATTTAATGNIDTEGSLFASSTLAVGGITTLYNDLRVNQYATTTASNGNFATEGTITADGILTITGNSVLTSADIGGAYSAGGSGITLTTAGKGQFNGDLEINGFATTTATSGNFANQGTVGVGTTTPSQELGVAGDGLFVSSATTTITISSTGAVGGGCLQMENGAGDTMYRIYVVAAGNSLRVEAGACQ